MTDYGAHPAGDRLRGRLLDQPDLADARLAGDHSQPAAADDGALQEARS
jgi:hypothetical protein